ncbi:hypothetical protein [Bernardetia sp.]|uniref:hypothetical protein n=1 Tax=Bernardetia sp. TaxID=1937974 RepID=UPI0025C0943E|nr:hypothetical protein [Bernardetia sp.]
MWVTKRVFILTSVLLLISNVAFSQAGVYKTYKDYLNNNLTNYGRYSSVYHFLGRFTVSFENERGKKTDIKIRKGNIWGYKNNNGDVYRVDEKNYPRKITSFGKIVVYGNYTEKGYSIVTKRDPQTGFSSTSSTPYLFSFGTNGDMELLSKNNLRRALKKRKDKMGLELLKKVSVFKGYLVMDFIRDYNEANK